MPNVATVWLAPPVTDADAPALQVAAALLSGGESSRLNQALVYRQQIADRILVFHAIQALQSDTSRIGIGQRGSVESAPDGSDVRQITHKASLASLLIIAGLPIGVAIGGVPAWEIVYVIALCSLVLVRHVDNIKRLIGRRELSANNR